MFCGKKMWKQVVVMEMLIGLLLGFFYATLYGGHEANSQVI